MKHFSFFLTFLFLCMFELSSQTISDFSADSLRKHVYYLASDELKGRNTGHEGQKLAAHYIARYFEDFGLEPAGNSKTNPYFQEFMMYYNSIYYFFPHTSESNYLRVPATGNFLYFGNESKATYTSEILCFTPDSLSKDSQSFMFMNSVSFSAMMDSIHLYYNNTNQTKFFVTLPGKEFKEISDDYPSGFYLLMKEGDNFMRIDSRNKQQNTESGKCRFVYESVSSYTNINLILTNQQFWKDYGYDFASLNQHHNIAFDLSRKNVSDTVFTENVLGYVNGSPDNGQVIIVGAHYDHVGYSNKGVFNGADDNASGTAVLIELARAFSQDAKEGRYPNKNILFIAFSGEEKGLLGSEIYAEFPYFPIDSTLFMLNMDMIGRPPYAANDRGRVFMLAFGKHKKDLVKTIRKSEKQAKCIKTYTHPGLINKIGWRYGSDHANFTKKGVSTVVFFTGMHEDYHKITDTAEKINYVNMSKISFLLYITIQKLAM